MSVLNIPKVMYKAQQAKKQMQKIEAVGQEGAVAVLMNGLNEIVEVQIDSSRLTENDSISREELEKILKKIQEDFRKAAQVAKKQIEKDLVSSTNMEDLKGMLGM